MEKLKIEKLNTRWLELKLGNIIVSGESFEPSYVIKSEITVDSKTFKKSCTIRSLYLLDDRLTVPCGEINDSSSIYGIILTKDLLVNFCGFKQCKDPSKYSRVVDNKYLFLEFSEISEYFYYKDIRLKYLHDLQNICRSVTGTDFMLPDFGHRLTENAKDNKVDRSVKFLGIVFSDPLTLMAIILMSFLPISLIINYIKSLFN